MYSPLQLASKYFRYCLLASNGKGHGTHSPFVFQFIRQILNDRQTYPAYLQVESLRARLRKDPSLLRVDDMGAGSSHGFSKNRSVASIARQAAKPRKFGQLLFRMVNSWKPQHILELGTSLGITTSYLSLGNPDAKLITLEGAGEVAKRAEDYFSRGGLKNIEIITGNFDDTLSVALKKMAQVDFAFIDGNHRLEPTLMYYHEVLPYINDQSVLVFDDIHWSSEMEQAWNKIKSNDAVTCSIDLFFIGIIFFRKEFREKQDFVIRF
jgi:predicted O-methyltransferase YrrM